MSSVADRVEVVRARIAAAAERVGRDPGGVRLVAVGKTHPPQVLREAVSAGVTDLGENRVEELVAKRGHVDGARWHFVGKLQSRKATDLVGWPVLIHSVDRRSLVDRLQRLAEREGHPVELLVQVNVGDDPRKGGCSLDETGDLVAYARSQPDLTVSGLMTIPPLPPSDADPGAAARPHFAALRELRDRLDVPGVDELSMGMTADLEAAVAEGATMVRVGTAIFGERGDRPWQPTR